MISVDLDPVDCYYAIHGLGVPRTRHHLDVVLDKCLPRFLALFEELGVTATFFVVGRIDDPGPGIERDSMRRKVLIGTCHPVPGNIAEDDTRVYSF